MTCEIIHLLLINCLDLLVHQFKVVCLHIDQVVYTKVLVHVFYMHMHLIYKPSG